MTVLTVPSLHCLFPLLADDLCPDEMPEAFDIVGDTAITDDDDDDDEDFEDDEDDDGFDDDDEDFGEISHPGGRPR